MSVSRVNVSPSGENFELLFLITKFLREGVCPEAGDLLQRALSDSDSALPDRVDWKGGKHKQTFQELEAQFPKITGHTLTDVLGCLLKSNGPAKSLLNLSFQGGQKKIPGTFSIVRDLQLGLGRKKFTSEPTIYSNIYSQLQLQRRCLGHLSSVFCLLFDKTGRYVFTGADDLLVKMWETCSGRLVFTFRGASSEISDMAVSEDNRMIAAGSTDKIIRVWCLLSAAPIAVLSKHTGTITALHFCPCALPDVPQYLAATSGDGTVSFWRYRYTKDVKKTVQFEPEPTRYHEKMRPGGAQMICAAFSSGGLFLATGSVDHHVRVYIMCEGQAKEGPVKVLEQEAHTDRVDSIQWANKPSLRFVTGSKDGTARIWSFSGGCWNSAVLRVIGADGRRVTFNKERRCEEPIRVTMVNWTCDDEKIITAVSDCSLCVWSVKEGRLLQRLTSHQDEVYVLEPHPTLPDILMSGAHDGNVIIWNVSESHVLFKHNNKLTQGHGAIFDAKWCPDLLSIAASDSHGHVLFFGTNSDQTENCIFKKCPEEMFFHTDYRPLLRDASNYVLDEQTQWPPHLLPPPFLVDVEGNPYPADIQRLVPGREHLSDSELLVPHDLPAASMSPRGAQRIPESPRIVEAPRLSTDNQEPRSNIDAMIAELASTHPIQPVANVEGGDHSYAAGPSSSDGGQQAELTSSVWRQRQLVRQDYFRARNLSKSVRSELGKSEKKLFAKEKERGALIFEGVPVGFHEGVLPKENQKSKQKKGNRARARVSGTPRAENRAATRAQPDNEDDEEDEAEDQDFAEDGASDSSLTESDLETSGSESDASTEYSDWGDNDLTPPQRTAKKSAKAISVEQENLTSDEDEPKPGPSRYAKKKTYKFNTRNLDDIPKSYWPSSWLAEYIPKKSPYFPQMGDEVMYFKQGHMGYIGLVQKRKCYKLNMKEQQWRSRSDLGNVELVKVVGMKYEIRPPRLCCLKLAVINQETNQLTGQKFSIKYHDMEDVVDFLILRHLYDASVDVTWTAGDRYRCQIEDSWWYGTVLGVSAFDETIPDSPFLSIKCLWDSGEEERLSPWDLDTIQPDGIGQEKVEKQIPVTKEEIEKNLYQPQLEEWRGLDSQAECQRITRGLEELMSMAHAENFNYPVDLTAFPDYMLEIEYPMDFSLIKNRLDNNFYRRSTAIQFDARYISTNAELYNRPKTEIVKCARILTDLVLMIIQNKKISNISREWHRLYEDFDWANTQEAKSPQKNSQSPLNPKQWKHDSMELLKSMRKLPDSAPFREAVDENEFPDYNRIVTTPMDLNQVTENLSVGEYSSPLDMEKEILLIFSNSMKYNTDKNSEVVKMTKRLKEWFQDAFQTVISNWRKNNRRMTIQSRKGTSADVSKPRNTPVKKKARHKSQEESEDDQSETKSPGKSRLFSDEDEQVVDPKGKGKGKGKGKSSAIAKRKTESQTRQVEVSSIQSNRNMRNRNSAGKSKAQVSQKTESPDQTSDDDEEEEDMTEKTSSSDSESQETVRPKRSAKAKVLHESSDEPVGRYSRSTPTKKSSTLHTENKSSQGRPIRMATQKALKNFQTGSDTEEGESSFRPGPSHFSRPQNTRERPSRRLNNQDSDSMEDASISRGSMSRTSARRANVSHGVNVHEEERRSVRDRNYSRSEVTISAADSSTDHIRASRTEQSRPQRHRVRPARLMDDEEEEEEEEDRVIPQRRSANQGGRMERSSRNSTRRREISESEDESLATRAKRSSDSRKRKSTVTQQQHSYKRVKRAINYRDAESNDEEEDSEDEVPISRRRTGKSKEVSKNSTERHQHNSYNRNKRTMNYRDVESNNEEEDSEDEIPISRRRKQGKSKRAYAEKESSSEESEGDGTSQQNDDLRLSHEEEEEEENLGRRRGSRRRVQVIRQPRQNFRPQRNRDSSRGRYREPSTEEDEEEAPLRQNRRNRHSVMESRQVAEESLSQAGVSMRGRVRRPNPRLYE